MNANSVKGKWLEIKGEIQKVWGDLTHDELEKTKGDIKSVAGLIQQKYGKTQAKNEDQLSAIYNKYISAKDELVENVKAKLKN